ncbi:F0F1 ATP synthase subunit A [Clostridium fallax]|uniref:ATP synthase subunit a n=1 Tax=Clostridium fallax TaxID=1533 RepID=A0A1M4VFQ2_9CLOT|nr:F0F1 ATP synthase subunit A [Clostridium fallax]SHE67690.1 ATP synthase F0 subcomplex A subunit [Clostridium fallax]SQB05742.1 F0F1 ATP synthase subunit A [Clostridium fallax]
MEPVEPIFSIPIGNLTFDITSGLVVQWVVMILLILLAVFSTRNLKKVPDKKQTIVEAFYDAVTNVVRNTMGEEYMSYVPFIGTLAVYLLILNLTGLVGVQPPTQSYNVALGLAIISFVLVQANAIKKVGIGGYFGGFAHPSILMLPLNVIERVMFLVSLSLRLFGNIFAATILIDLIYQGLGNLTWFAELGIPVPFHAYFDIFDGTIQMVIFLMLTMINIKTVAEH